MRWVFENGHFANEEKQLGKDYYALIKKYANAIQKETCHFYGEGNYIEIDDTVIGRSFFLMACIEYGYKNYGKCGQYCYGGNVDELVVLVEKLKPLLCI
ncbi:MAG: hypothetical protein NC433_12435 [Clostridiales bacterium]|nr:hypothetical protein [Clostridiales bacterium]